MKIKGTKDYLSGQLSTIEMIFKKLTGIASETALVAAFNKKKDGNKILGWTSEDIRKRRLMAFVKGIQANGAGLVGGTVNQLNEFEINLDTFDYENLSFDLYQVTQKKTWVALGELDHEMHDLENRTRITYNLDKHGRYIIDIKYLGVSIPSSPFKVDIRNPTATKTNAVSNVVAHGKGLKRCLTGEVNTVQVDVKKLSGQGHFHFAVDGSKENIPLHVTASKLGYTIQYVPNEEGEFFLRIKLDGKHITGSPFLITAENKEEEVPQNGKNLFKRGVLAGSKEKRNDLQP